MSVASDARPVAVVGAGWAGLTAALALARAGHPVHLLDSAPVAGGRARSLTLDETTLDNGQHILVGACEAALAQIRSVGVDPEQAFHALPFGLELRAADGTEALRLNPASPRLPALGRALYAALKTEPLRVRLRATLGAVGLLHGPLHQDRPVRPWLQYHHQPPALIERLWEPLCLAIMNTPLRSASARVFREVLREALTHGAEAARLLLPARPLGAIYPEPALAELRERGATVDLGRRIRRIELPEAPGSGASPVMLEDRGGRRSEARAVILATAPAAAAGLLPEAADPGDLRERIRGMGGRSICTVYLRYPRAVEELPPLLGLLGQYGQWAVPRRVSGHPEWVAVVTSAADDAAPMDADTRCATVAAELARCVPGLDTPVAQHAVCERRATFDACTGIDTRRPEPRTACRDLLLAGDYLVPGLPSTLEAAVRSGLESAHLLMEDLS
ncbi:hydroxysqualene dehydroxylase HpnE [Thioalkalivibrio halophilus]|uniref:Desaturase n=1 Tax=Thioalkalivibrio halophilus TaxID=252474 RepID=A0A1V2ZVC5_9GAMM|nr:hydroxysqualene dehydroxylase HpnE [Thioalkalivibrio halophilus]OOC08995.1 desaturase [Thioalkalivibrio halophilus]